MLKERELRNFMPNIKCTGNVTLVYIKSVIEMKALEYHIPVAFYDEQIKKGGMLNFSAMDCLVVYHPDHRNDYFKFAISVENSIISISEFGESKNQKKLNSRQDAGATVKAGWNQANKNAERGVSVGGVLTTGVLVGGTKMLMSLGGSKQKQQVENEYYSLLRSIFSEIFS